MQPAAAIHRNGVGSGRPGCPVEGPFGRTGLNWNMRRAVVYLSHRHPADQPALHVKFSLQGIIGFESGRPVAVLVDVGRLGWMPASADAIM